MDEDTLCSIVDEETVYFDTSYKGIQALKRCWYKLKENEDAAKKVKELVDEDLVLSKKEIESLENWAQEENVNMEVREAVDDLTEKGKSSSRCAVRVANTLAEVLE